MTAHWNRQPSVVVCQGDTATVECYGRGGVVVAFAIIDSADVAKVAKFRWHVSARGYPATRGNKLRMHSLILPKAKMVDHRNRNKLDNRRSNLRSASPLQNTRNAVPPLGPSGVRGVCWSKKDKKWKVTVKVRDVTYYLGSFDDLESAAEVATTARIGWVQ